MAALPLARSIASQLPWRHAPQYRAGMASAPRHMHLGLFLQGAGHHLAGWRHPDADSGSENLPHLIRQAVAAERAKFDMVFLADGLTSSEDGHPSQIARFEPLMVLTALCDGDEPDRSRRDRLDHLRRAVPSRAGVRLARSHQPRPRRLERGDHVLRSTGREFRHQASGPRRPLRHRRGVHRRHPRAVGLAGTTTPSRKTRRRGVYVDQSKRACHRPQGPIFLGQGSAQHVAFAAGPPDHRAIRIVGARPAARGSHRRRGVHRAAEPRKRARVLPRTERPARRVRPQPAIARHHAGLPAGARRHGEGGARQARAAATVGPTRARSFRCCRTGWATTSRATISMARCRNCRRPISCRAAPSSSPTPRAATT